MNKTLKEIRSMEEIEVPRHEHPVRPFTRFLCGCCGAHCTDHERIYGGYRCNEPGCDKAFHKECAEALPEIINSFHPEHPLKLILDYSCPNACSLCQHKFGIGYSCSLCDFHIDLKCVRIPPPTENSCLHEHPLKLSHGEPSDSLEYDICGDCKTNPPPVCVVSSTTHEHQLHLVPRRMDFTCNACGTLGDRSPYFCLQCNFMIHRECIDLPRVININRHDHRISYTRRLGHGESPWKCGVCRKKVDGFYGAYASSKVPSFVVHARCATREDVWDNVELEGMPEEEVIAPFEVVDDTTIRHFSHDHNLHINKDGQILHENIVCEACVFQIGSEYFYSCKNCDFILHEKCANLPRKKRHVCSNQPLTLETVSRAATCSLCDKQV
ncbi:hypothetical protein HID58_016330 [Brassica napus]|uniref:Zinc finger PHD-type domain-containing protein n=1 Tax=Brassica napus TaxID=3708 RepID=A0ABQ8DMZ7_BRANA|nr:hypothetical protein HID58_016330 [Brassica napus]